MSSRHVTLILIGFMLVGLPTATASRHQAGSDLIAFERWVGDGSPRATYGSRERQLEAGREN